MLQIKFPGQTAHVSFWQLSCSLFLKDGGIWEKVDEIENWVALNEFALQSPDPLY